MNVNAFSKRSYEEAIQDMETKSEKIRALEAGLIQLFKPVWNIQGVK